MVRVRYVLHDHRAKKAGRHLDLRIQIPNKRDRLASFAIPKSRFPNRGEKVLVIRTLDHPLKWLVWERDIKHGYGTGTFKIVQSGICKIYKWTSNKIIFEIDGDFVSGVFIILKYRHSRTSKAWILIRAKDRRSYIENYLDFLI